VAWAIAVISVLSSRIDKLDRAVWFLNSMLINGRVS
jgi:hypothetical protein